MSIQAGSLPIMFFPWNSGTVDLTALLRSGSTSGMINVSVHGYAAGDYSVSVVTESSSSTVVLGSLTVTSGSFPLGSGSNPIVYSDTAAGHEAVAAGGPAVIVLPPFGLSDGHAKFGGKRAPFPAGFNPFDIATLSLSDSNGNVVSTTTLTPVPSGYYSALSPLVAGASASGATGYALIKANTPPVFLPMALTSVVTNGLIHVDPLPPVLFHPSTGRLVIHAQGLPASTTLTYAADGTDLGTVTTGTTGSLSVFALQGQGHVLPSTLDLFSVKTVTVHDALGNVLVSAGF
jgi:hypothetical protein